MDYSVLVAPLDGYQGRAHPFPWDYRVTVAIPHLDTPELLPLALGLWRLQTVRPFLMVIDTGSPAASLTGLETLRAPDCELHYIRAHGYRHASAPVCTALDLAQALCRTEYLVHTHADLFPRRRDLLAWLLGQCDEERPVVGWQMSPRDTSTAPSKDEWKHAVSHTCTCLHMPTVHLAGLTWAMEAYFAARPHERGEFAAWPDTESPFYLACVKRGIGPVLLGPEKNFQRDVCDWWDHARSVTGLKAASRSGELIANLRYSQALGYLAAAQEEAQQRLASWQAEPSH